MTLLLGALGTLGYDGTCSGLAGSATPCARSVFALRQFVEAGLVGLLVAVFGLPFNLAIYYLRWRMLVL